MREDGKAGEDDSAANTSGAGAYPPEGYAWYVVFLLLAIYTLSFIDRQILALLVEPIKRDLELSDFAFSLLSGFAFALFYTVFGLPFARIADSRSRRGLIAFGVAFWSAATAACGLAKVYWHLLAARIGVGVGEATLTPAANSLIADYFPKHKLGRALAVYSLGIPIGSAMAFILGGVVVGLIEDLPPQDLPIIGRTYGWQLAFFAVGLPGIAMALLMATVKEPIRRGRMSAGPAGQALPIKDVLAFMAGHARAYAALFFGPSFLSLLGYGTTIWMIAFYSRTYGLSASDAGLLFGGVLLVFGTGGILLGGAGADRRIARGQSDGPLRVLFWAAALTLPAGIAFPLMPNWISAAAVMSLSVLVTNMPWGTAYAAIAAITPNEIRGQAAALYLFIVNLIGLGAGPSVIAAFTDYVYRDEMLLNYAMASTTAVVAPIAALLFLSGLAPYRRAMAAADAREREAG